MQNAAHSCEKFRRLIQTPDLPDLGPGPRPARMSLAELNRAVSGFLRETEAASNPEPPVRAAALLWHDYLDESHSISQNIHGADGSFLHGIMHRREPDYPNAKYWFHRVGDHPCFPEIARGVVRLLETAEISGERPPKEWAEHLVPGGRWDPLAFIDACQAVAQRSPAETADATVLRDIQQIEFDALLRHIFGAT